MIYYVSKVFWLVAAPTRALVLISAIAALWAELGGSKCAAWLAAAAACGLVIGAFTPIGVALMVPLKHRFQFSPPDLQAPDGIILLAGSGSSGIDTVSVLSQDYPKARLIFSGFSATDKTVLKKFARLGGDPARVDMQFGPRTTFEDALFSAALLQPRPSERWLLVTSALHMPRAIGCFRIVGFQVKPYPVEFRTARSHPSVGFASGSTALSNLDAAVKEWIGLVAYRLMGRTDALFPRP
jgi:uncharacterized SAM-binding protein YcdF (DUF218 family)